MLLKYNVQIIKFQTQEFSKNFIEKARNMKRTLEKINIYRHNFIPENLVANNLKIQVYYSLDRDQYFFNFTQSKKDSFEFFIVNGNPFPTGFFSIGSSAENITISNGTIVTNGMEYHIGESYLMSSREFKEAFQDPEMFLVKKLQYELEKINYPDRHEQKVRISNLLSVAKNLEQLIFNKNTPELVIDKFLENNPVVLEKAMNLIDLKHQVILDDIHKDIGQNLKPDLIAFDFRNREWVIVDYKKAKRNIIRNPNGVRTTFIADVNLLQAQLADYRKYFEDKTQRNHIKAKYGIELKYPKTYGIIGIVPKEEEDDFKETLENHLRWFNVIPYNYLLDNFRRSIEDLAKEFKII